MALLYRDVYEASRVYYGTDTRACGLLLGAALACVLPPARAGARASAVVSMAAGVSGLAALTALALTLGQYDPLLYQGGFLVTGLATAVVIVAVSRQGSLFGRALGVLPLRWVGLRSYGIYLWHWPLLLLTTPLAEGAWWLLPAQVTLTVGAAEVSYRVVEWPARHGALGRLWAAILAPAADTWGYRRTLGTLSGVVGIVALAVSFAATSPSSANASLETVPQPLVLIAAIEDPETLAEEWAPLPLPAPEPEPEAPPPQEPPPAPSGPPPKPLPVIGAIPMPEGVSVTAIGDSVLLGASRQLVYTIGAIEVDADIGRQVWTGVNLLRARVEANNLGDVVVVAFGSNGTFTAREFDQIMEALAGTKLVVFVNVRVPRPWEEANNKVIAGGVAAYSSAVLVDWYSATEGHPELFGDDGVHLTGAGVRLYAGLIADTIIANWK
jgi:hypothetical protein